MKKQLAYLLACACLFWACANDANTQETSTKTKKQSEAEESPYNYCSFKRDITKRSDNTPPFDKATKIEAISFDFDSFFKENKQTYDEMKGVTKLENGILQIPYIIQRRFLSKEETVKLFETLIFNRGELSAGAHCYLPRDVLVFYEEEKPFAYLEICFMCRGWRTVGCEFDEFCEEKWQKLRTFFPAPKKVD